MSSSRKVYVGNIEGLPVVGSTRAAVEMVLAVAAGKTDFGKKLQKSIIDEASTYKKKSSVARSNGEVAGNVQEVAEQDALSGIFSAPKGKPSQKPKIPLTQQKPEEILNKVRNETLKKFDEFLTKDDMKQITITEKRSGRGEHVINNDVLAFYRKSIQRFLTTRHANMLDLRARFNANPLWQDCDNPVPPEVKTAIMTEMVAHFDDTEIYINANALVYGTVTQVLHQRVQEYLNENNEAIRQQVIHMVNYTNENEVYVDVVARLKWVGNSQQRQATFRNCRTEVTNMYERLYLGGENCRMTTWVTQVNAILGQ